MKSTGLNKYCFLFVFLMIFPAYLFPEGPKSLEPTRFDVTMIKINKELAYNDFATYNAIPDERLYVRVANVQERICFGFGDWGSGNMMLKVRDPNGNLVFGPYNLSNKTGDPGFINTWDEAIAGPDIVNASGYKPLVFTPSMTGDYYFEFSFTALQYRCFKYFDITVVDPSNKPINGRVWSKSWQFWAGQYASESGSRSTLYIYSNDSVVSSVYFNGMKAESMEMYANSYGCQAPPVAFSTSRQSLPGRQEMPQYKVFLNDPDSNVFPSKVCGGLVPNSLSLKPDCSGIFTLQFEVTKPGIVEAVIKVSHVPGIQPEDVTITDSVHPGINKFIWNGLNGLGVQVANGAPVSVTITYIASLTNFLIYDALSQTKGYVISIIRPAGLDARIFWDDTQLPSGTANFTGCVSSVPDQGCHTWSGDTTSGTGNDNTINTWWYTTNSISDNTDSRYYTNTNYEFSTSFCAGDTIIIEGTAIISEGDYTFSYPSHLTGCDSSRIYHVTYLPSPVVSLGADSTICEGSIVSFDAGPGTGYFYSWSNLTTGEQNISSNEIFTTGITGKYMVTVTNPNGCRGRDTVVLTVNPLPQVTNNPLQKSICSGSSTGIILTSTLPESIFTWKVVSGGTNISGYSDSSAPDTVINQVLTNSGNVDESVIYRITPHAKGCDGPTVNYQVIIHPVSKLTTFPLNQEICSSAQTSIILTSNVSGAGFAWIATSSSPMVSGFSDGSGDGIYQTLINTSALLETVTYHITPSYSGCDGSATDYIVTVNAVPNVVFLPSTQSICSGQTTNVDIQSSTPGTVFSWIPSAEHGSAGVTGQTSGNGNKLIQTLYSYSNAPAVQEYIVNPAVAGCPGTPGNIPVIVNPLPVVTFTTCFENPTQSNARPILLKGGLPLNGIYSGVGVNGGYFNPVTSGAGSFPVTYTYSNTYGCSGQASQIIRVLADTISFTCGNLLTDIRDGKQYPTIQIGTQCWMAANLDYGTFIVSSSMQRNNCIPEKYCFRDQQGNCAGKGGLYQWDELMCYQDEAGIQGLCPPGWHVPDESEWNTLFTYYINSAHAGGNLKTSGNSGFNAVFPGQIFLSKSWSFNDFATHFWTATSRSGFKAWAHALNTFDPGVAFYPAYRSNAFPARCIKN